MSQVESLLNRLANTSEKREKLELIALLGDTKEKDTLPILIEILDKDTDNEIKSYTANAIAKIGSKIATEKLIYLTKNDSWVTRMKAAEALGEIGDKKALKYLIRLMKKDPESNVREWAVISLGKIGTKKATKAIISSLLEDEEKEVRKEAAIALGKLKDKSSFYALTQAYQTDDEYQVRWAAAAAIIKIDHDNSIDLLNSLIDKLLKIVNSEKDELIVGAAARTLGEIGNEVVAKTLYRKMKVSKELVRLEINLALGKLAKKHNYNNLEDFVKNLEKKPSL